MRNAAVEFKENEGRRSVPLVWVSAGGPNQRGLLRLCCPGKTGGVCHLCWGTQQRATQHQRPPRIRLPPLSCQRRCQAEAEAQTTRPKTEDGVEASIKGRRRALISPWPPSLDLLHSGRRDEMKSNGEGERVREQRTVRGRGVQNLLPSLFSL